MPGFELPHWARLLSVVAARSTSITVATPLSHYLKRLAAADPQTQAEAMPFVVHAARVAIAAQTDDDDGSDDNDGSDDGGDVDASDADADSVSSSEGGDGGGDAHSDSDGDGDGDSNGGDGDGDGDTAAGADVVTQQALAAAGQELDAAEATQDECRIALAEAALDAAMDAMLGSDGLGVNDLRDEGEEEEEEEGGKGGEEATPAGDIDLARDAELSDWQLYAKVITEPAEYVAPLLSMTGVFEWDVAEMHSCVASCELQIEGWPVGAATSTWTVAHTSP